VEDVPRREALKTDDEDAGCRGARFAEVLSRWGLYKLNPGDLTHGV
jgi:hypothetical protein